MFTFTYFFTDCYNSDGLVLASFLLRSLEISLTLDAKFVVNNVALEQVFSELFPVFLLIIIPLASHPSHTPEVCDNPGRRRIFTSSALILGISSLIWHFVGYRVKYRCKIISGVN
jgi:hypothetical protein